MSNASTDPGADQTPDLRSQTQFWDDWNAASRENSLTEVSQRQARIILGWLESGPRDLKILDVGCGPGWFSHEVSQFGAVTAVDLATTVLDRARDRYPEVTFLAGDAMSVDLPLGAFDCVVCLEVLAHVDDQEAFIGRLAALLRPGGELMMATQNRPVLEQRCHVPPAGDGQVRRWTDATELRRLLDPYFVVDELRSVTPMATRWPWRALTSWRLHRTLGPLGRRLAALLESRGWGWTLMVRTRLRPVGVQSWHERDGAEIS